MLLLPSCGGSLHGMTFRDAKSEYLGVMWFYINQHLLSCVGISSWQILNK